jgi:hypothetical protein
MEAGSSGDPNKLFSGVNQLLCGTRDGYPNCSFPYFSVIPLGKFPDNILNWKPPVLPKLFPIISNYLLTSYHSKLHSLCY